MKIFEELDDQALECVSGGQTTMNPNEWAEKYYPLKDELLSLRNEWYGIDFTPLRMANIQGTCKISQEMFEEAVEGAIRYIERRVIGAESLVKKNIIPCLNVLIPSNPQLSNHLTLLTNLI